MTLPKAEAAESKFRIIQYWGECALEQWRVVDIKSVYHEWKGSQIEEVWGWKEVLRFEDDKVAEAYARFKVKGPQIIKEFTVD